LVLKRIGFAGITAFLCLVVILGTGEILVRLLDPQFSNFGFGYLVPDLELRYKNRPDCRLRLKTGGLDADFCTNSQGFRANRGIQVADGRKQVLFIGDSFTYGFGVRLRDLFSTVLQEKIDQQDLNVEIINAGVVGYGTDQEYLCIKGLCNRMTPRLVVVNVYANDPTDNLWRALFYLENDRLKQNPPLVLSSTGRLKWVLEGKSQLFIFLSRLAAREISRRELWGSINPYLGVMLARFRILSEHLRDWPFYEKPPGFNVKQWRPPLNLDDFYGKKRGEDIWEYAWTLEKGLIEGIAAFLGKKKISALFVLVPMKCQYQGRETAFDLFQEKMIGIFRDLDLPFLDLREEMVNQPGLYLTHDGHWSIRGHAFFADIMLRYLSDLDRRSWPGAGRQ